MIVDIVDKYRTDDNNPIKNLRLKIGLVITYLGNFFLQLFTAYLESA